MVTFATVRIPMFALKLYYYRETRIRIILDIPMIHSHSLFINDIWY